jgi:predicted ATPase
LIARVWGPLVVDEGSLRFHIASLRKALEIDGVDAGYVRNIPGIGYCLAAPVSWVAASPGERNAVAEPAIVSHLPRRPLRVVGRHGAVADITTQLKDWRFVSIVGAGGIGKTTVALAIAHEVLSEFAGEVYLLDLAAVQSAHLVPAALASLLGVPVVSETPLPAILAFLRERRLLLLLDSCEHLIEPVAALAEEIFRGSSRLHILATSRESLRAEGERVYHLPPLGYPRSDPRSLSASQALQFPAVQLFVDQVAAGGYPFELTDVDAPIVAEMCRRLDGIALALELAASRVGVHGVQGTASMLNNQFSLLWRGRRTALPRHQTLSATLDWSYQLLSEAERRTLRRLAVFIGPFSLEAAQYVVGENLDLAAVTETLATLAEKSLVALGSGSTVRYRLLDTTRAYAWLRLVESGEQMPIALRHAEYITERLQRLQPSVSMPSSPEAVSFFVEHLGSVRAALEWCFSAQGNIATGARLASASAPLFLWLSMLAEPIAWIERALDSFGLQQQPASIQLNLQACLGFALVNTTHSASGARAAFSKALTLAERLEDTACQLLLLHGIYRVEMRSGELRGLAELTHRFEAAAKHMNDLVSDGIAHGIRACTCCFAGQHSEVLTHARIALGHPLHSPRINATLYGYTHRIGARNVLARSLWTLGYPDQAVLVAGECVAEADRLADPPAIVYSLVWNVLVYLRVGDWPTADRLLARLVDRAAEGRMATYYPGALGFQGILAVLRGELSRGTELLQTALESMRTSGYELHRGLFSGALAEGLANAGQSELAHATIADAIAWAKDRGALADIPELLRVKAEILMTLPGTDGAEAEACLESSLELARAQSALSLELRAATSLARLWAGNGRVAQALTLLAPIHGRFSEGLQTRDLVTAQRLLTELQAHV